MDGPFCRFGPKYVGRRRCTRSAVVGGRGRGRGYNGLEIERPSSSPAINGNREAMGWALEASSLALSHAGAGFCKLLQTRKGQVSIFAFKAGGQGLGMRSKHSVFRLLC